MQKVINCPCGFIVKADSDDQLVTKAQQHAKEVHQMDLTRAGTRDGTSGLKDIP